jgi:dCTP deaminase
LTPRRTPLPHILDSDEPGVADALFSAPFGLFGRQKIRAMIGRKLIKAETPLESSQLQPASLDLRLSKEAYRVRSSFLPGRDHTVRDRLKSLNAEPVSLAGKGAVLEKGIVYIARLMERLELRPNLSGAANPKSSTGRIDIFTRLIVDGGEAFDEVPLDYQGELWLEISPRSFSVRVKAGVKLSQVRFRSRHPQQRDRHTFTLDDAEIRKRHLARSMGHSTCARAWCCGSILEVWASPSSATKPSRTATSSTSTACAAMRSRIFGSPYGHVKIGG